MSCSRLILFIFIGFIVLSCKNGEKNTELAEDKKSVSEEPMNILVEKPSNIEVPEGMVWIPGGTFMQGAVTSDGMAMNHEKPAHEVAVDGFFMDKTEVTNAEFQKFVDETGYVTVAERDIDWPDIKKQLPPGTPKPHDSILQPGSLTFKKAEYSISNLYDHSQWWNWTIGAN
jgi:sulfatase modifying factor 1